MAFETICEAKQSTYAAHGTDLHDVVKKYNEYDSSPLDGLNTDDRFLVLECIDYAKVLCVSIGHNNYHIKAESHVSLEPWGIPDVYGTLDYSILDPIKRHIDIIDWKFGAGIMVFAKENPQMLAYAAGAVGWPTTIQNVTLHVVQPALEHFDTWKLTTTELYDWVHGTLALAINRCSSDEDIFVPGVEQCRWCEAKNYCYSRVEAIQIEAAKLFDAHAKLAKCPEPEELVKLIEQAPLVEKAIKDIYLYVHTEMLKGVVFPRLKLVQGRSNRAWIDEMKTIEWLSENTSIEEFYNSKIKSPSQIEKEARALKKNDKFKALFNKPPGKVSLVSESDSRPAIQIQSSAVDMFKDYQAPDKLE